MDDKWLIDGYEALHAIKIDGAEQIVAEKECKYRIYLGQRVSILGLDAYTTVFEDSNYLKAMREFTHRINAALDRLDLDRVYRGGPLDHPLTAEDCTSGGMGDDLKGKVVVVKAQSLLPEYRTCSHQLMLATGGFGCSPNSRGQAVYTTNLYSGEENRWNRSDILGVVAENTLPAWAQENLIKLRESVGHKSVIQKIRMPKAQPEHQQKSTKPHKSEPER